jgi:hypothetical protein
MDMPRGNRFCWPAQDRVRAHPPLRAPRKSPVFTASVSFARKSPIGKATPTAHRVRSHAACRVPSRHDALGVEMDSSCSFDAGLSEKTPLFRGSTGHNRRQEMARSTVTCLTADLWESGVVQARLDWRVMGDQDEAGEEPGSPFTIVVQEAATGGLGIPS